MDPVIWGFKAVKPFDAEHPIGSGIMVHYSPGEEVPAGDWGRAEGFMLEAGTIMRYAKNVVEMPTPQVALAAQVGGNEEREEPSAPPAPAVDPLLADTADEAAPEDDDTVSAEGFPRHVGGSIYELSDGEHVRGKQAALTAQAALDVAAEAAGQ